MGILAAFRELDATVEAIEDLKRQKITDITVYTPTPRHEIEEAVDPPTSTITSKPMIVYGTQLATGFPPTTSGQ